MMKAYIDDSNNSGPAWLVLGGYIATAEAWAKFSDEWQEVLDLSPRLKRFKMSEAHGQWSDEQWRERLPLFYNLIKKYAVAAVSLAWPYDEHKVVFAGTGKAENPYHFAFTQIIKTLGDNSERMGLGSEIEFVFDKGNSERIANAWPDFMDNQPPGIRAKFGARPQFADDEKALPLQAADFIAWMVRRKALVKCGLEKPMRPVPWNTKEPGLLHLEVVVPPDFVQWAYDELFKKGRV